MSGEGRRWSYLRRARVNALPDDEVKHYDADSACASGDFWARYPGILVCVGLVSVPTKVIVYPGIGIIVPDGCSKPRYSTDSDVLDIDSRTFSKLVC